jgi:formate-dependent phosphoribosylglycinamide formyltransferase (GAR transformylase)
VVVKWEAEERAAVGLEKTLAECDCEVRIYGSPQPDGYRDLEEMGRKMGSRDGRRVIK